MENYYAIVRSGDHLAHYGVKGMQWGVRKAIEKGNDKRLDRTYRKAAKKLQKLNEKADIGVQNKNAEKYNKIAKRTAKIGGVGLGIGLAGTGLNRGLFAINTVRKNAASSKLKKLYDEEDRIRHNAEKQVFKAWHNDPAMRSGKGYYTKPTDNLVTNISNKYKRDSANLASKRDKIRTDFNREANTRKTVANASQLIGNIGVAAGLGSMAISGVSKAKAYAAKKRTTAEGHAKAVAKRDAWQKEMRNAFKGTKYSGLPKQTTKKRRK